MSSENAPESVVDHSVVINVGDKYNVTAPYPEGTLIIADDGAIYRLTGFMGSYNSQHDIYLMDRAAWMKHERSGETITNIHYRGEVPEGSVILVGTEGKPETLAEAIAFHAK